MNPRSSDVTPLSEARAPNQQTRSDDRTRRLRPPRRLLRPIRRLSPADTSAFENVFRVAPAPMLITRRGSGEILAVNSAFETLLGYSATELIGLTSKELGIGDEPGVGVGSRTDVLAEVPGPDGVGDKPLRLLGRDREIVARTSMELVEYRGLPSIVTVFTDATDEHVARARLRAPEQHYRTLVRKASDAIVIFRPDGTIEEVNDAACRLLGYAPSDLIGSLPRDLIPTSDRRRVARMIVKLNRGETIREELPFIRHDGSLLWAEMTANALAWGGGQAILRDITARRDAEQRAERLLHLYAATADIDRAIGRIDEPDSLLAEACRIAVDVGRFRTAAAGFFDPESAVRFRWVATPTEITSFFPHLTDALERDGLDAQLAGLVALREDRTMVLTAADIEAGDNRDDFVASGLKSVVVVPLRSGGTVVGGLAVFDAEIDAFGRAEVGLVERIADDVSHRLETIAHEQARRATEADRDRLALAIERTSEAILIADPRGDVVYVNPAFERLTGSSRSEVLGRPFAAWIFGRPVAGDEWVQLLDEIQSRIASGQDWSGETPARHSDGSLYQAWGLVNAIRDANGGIESYIIVVRDVTHERDLEAKLRQAQRLEAVGQLAGWVAHDFNNLVLAIRGYADLVAMDLPADDRRRDDLEQVIRAADRAGSLTGQLLAFSRRQLRVPEVVDPAAAIAEVVPLVRHLVGEAVEVVVDARTDLWHLSADPGQLEQVIVNLAINARDAMPGGGRLEIRLENAALTDSDAGDWPLLRPGEYVALTVADTGEGMDEATRARIFEPFFTTKAPGHGTGLGLPSVFGIVEQSGGSVRVDSELGQGTSFTILLPRSPDRASHEPRAAVPGPSPRGDSTVLVVDDDDAIREYMRRVLVQLGYDVLVAANADEALGLAASDARQIDLLISDGIMPGLRGPELAAQLRRDRPDVAVLFVSGDADDLLTCAVAGSAGRTLFLAKPFSAQDLAQRVREAIGQRTA